MVPYGSLLVRLTIAKRNCLLSDDNNCRRKISGIRLTLVWLESQSARLDDQRCETRIESAISIYSVDVQVSAI